ncbi:SDR family NAD(P)-dependent oxidoreductase [Jatrophihabitans sp. DSM 45814]
MPHGELAGRVALVTGAGRGIGRAHVIALARAGAKVVVNDVGKDVDGSGATATVAEDVVKDINDAGGTAVADYSDISSFSGAAQAVATAVTTFGQIDIVVNNAGIVGGGLLPDIEETFLHKMFDVHLVGTLGTMRAALPHMCERGWGRIVNTVSEVALTPTGGGPLYGAAKAAVWSATLAAAAEYSGSGITVNGLSPGARTRMSAETIDKSSSSKLLDLDPAHVAAALGYLVSDEAADISGHIIHVAGIHIREYLPVRRTADTDLVRRLNAALKTA